MKKLIYSLILLTFFIPANIIGQGVADPIKWEIKNATLGPIIKTLPFHEDKIVTISQSNSSSKKAFFFSVLNIHTQKLVSDVQKIYSDRLISHAEKVDQEHIVFAGTKASGKKAALWVGLFKIDNLKLAKVHEIVLSPKVQFELNDLEIINGTDSVLLSAVHNNQSLYFLYHDGKLSEISTKKPTKDIYSNHLAITQNGKKFIIETRKTRDGYQTVIKSLNIAQLINSTVLKRIKGLQSSSVKQGWGEAEFLICGLQHSKKSSQVAFYKINDDDDYDISIKKILFEPSNGNSIPTDIIPSPFNLGDSYFASGLGNSYSSFANKTKGWLNEIRFQEDANIKENYLKELRSNNGIYSLLNFPNENKFFLSGFAGKSEYFLEYGLNKNNNNCDITIEFMNEPDTLKLSNQDNKHTFRIEIRSNKQLDIDDCCDFKFGSYYSGLETNYSDQRDTSVYTNSKGRPTKRKLRLKSGNEKQSNKFVYEYKETVFIPTGYKTLYYTVNCNNLIFKNSIVTHRKIKKPALHIVSIGVPSDLKYTNKDAVDILNVFKTQSGVFYDHVGTDLLISKDQTKTDYLQNFFLDSLKQRFKNYEGAANIDTDDLIIVFISTHGYSENGKLSLVTSDYKDGTNRRLRFQEDVMVELDKIPCKKLILVDACFSGLARVGKTTRALPQRYYDIPKGTAIFTASSGDEIAYEHKGKQNGAFAEVILEVLYNKFIPDTISRECKLIRIDQENELYEAIDIKERTTSKKIRKKFNSLLKEIYADNHLYINELDNYINQRIPYFIKSIPDIPCGSVQTPNFQKSKVLQDKYGNSDFPFYYFER